MTEPWKLPMTAVAPSTQVVLPPFPRELALGMDGLELRVERLETTVEALLTKAGEQKGDPREPLPLPVVAQLACEVVKASLSMTEGRTALSATEEECMGTAADLLASLFRQATPEQGPEEQR